MPNDQPSQIRWCAVNNNSCRSSEKRIKCKRNKGPVVRLNGIELSASLISESGNRADGEFGLMLVKSCSKISTERSEGWKNWVLPSSEKVLRSAGWRTTMSLSAAFSAIGSKVPSSEMMLDSLKAQFAASPICTAWNISSWASVVGALSKRGKSTGAGPASSGDLGRKPAACMSLTASVNACTTLSRSSSVWAVVK